MEFRLFSLPVVMCVGSCLILLLLCHSRYDWLYFLFLSCAIAKRGLYSYVCCSVINFPNRWYSCIYFCSQQFIWLPLLHCLSSFNVVSAVPNSCLFCIIWFAYADCGLQFFIWLMCSLYLICISLPDCPTYFLLHVIHFMLYIPFGLFGLSGFMVNCLNIVLVAL